MYTDCSERHARKSGAVWIQGSHDTYREVVQGNGARMIRVACGACEKKIGFLPFDVWRRWVASGAMLTLPSIVHDPREHEPCSYSGCTNMPTEYHHFAPRNTFGDDADNWVCGYLCRPHHRQWHQTMDGYSWHRKRSA